MVSCYCDHSFATCLLFSCFLAPFGVLDQKATLLSIYHLHFIFYSKVPIWNASLYCYPNVLSWWVVAATILLPRVCYVLAFWPLLAFWTEKPPCLPYLTYISFSTGKCIRETILEIGISMCWPGESSLWAFFCHVFVVFLLFGPFRCFGPKIHLSFHISPKFHFQQESAYGKLFV